MNYKKAIALSIFLIATMSFFYHWGAGHHENWAAKKHQLPQKTLTKPD